MVWHQFSKLDEVGSIPISRSGKFSGSENSKGGHACPSPLMASYPSGKGPDCNPGIRRFDSDTRLKACGVPSLWGRG